MKVWIAMAHDWEWDQIIGVFATEEEAQAEADRGRSAYSGYDYTVADHVVGEATPL